MHEPAADDHPDNHVQKYFQRIARDGTEIVVFDESQENGNDGGEYQQRKQMAFKYHFFLPLARSKAFKATR
jgi:hypothetical protein